MSTRVATLFSFSLPRTYNNDVIFGNVADSMANVWTTQYDCKINFGRRLFEREK